MRRCPRALRHVILVAAFGMMAGCGGGGVEPNVPATLTAEQEQAILDQVEGTSSQEQGQ